MSRDMSRPIWDNRLRRRLLDPRVFKEGPQVVALIDKYESALDVIAHMPSREDDYHFNWLRAQAAEALGMPVDSHETANVIDKSVCVSQVIDKEIG